MILPSDLGDGLGVAWPVVVDEDTGAAGDEDHDERHDDVDVGHRVLQIGEALAVEVEQQGHHAHGQQRGAGSHHNTEVRRRRTRRQRGCLIISTVDINYCCRKHTH